MKKRIFVLFMAVFFIFTAFAQCVAQAEEANYDLSKDEIIVLIEYHMNNDSSIASDIPGLNMRRKGREKVYYYKNKTFSKADKEDLFSVLTQIKEKVSKKSLSGLSENLMALQQMKTKKSDKMVR